MTARFLLCTDLDRTLLPNGTHEESPQARARFAQLAATPGVFLAYVSGRHRALVEQAINNYRLPIPDYVVGDVGTTLYRVGPAQAWQPLPDLQQEYSTDWAGKTHADLSALLQDLADLQIQEPGKQGEYKLSYYAPLQCDRERLDGEIQRRLQAVGIHANLVWSIDEPGAISLLDVLPARAGKLHAIETLMRLDGFDPASAVFAGDSGNDLEVLASAIPAVLVANTHEEVKLQAQRLAAAAGHSERLYLAGGDFLAMNGNYSAGILEGIAHYHPELLPCMQLPSDEVRG